MKRIHVTIYGNVQGVGFRYFLQNKAFSLNLKGFAINNNNEVEAEFEGREDAIEKIIALCRKGPGFAKVEKIEAREIPLKKDFSFEIN